MQADGTLIEFARIVYAMDRLRRIDCAGMRRIHLYSFSNLKFTGAVIDVLCD